MWRAAATSIVTVAVTGCDLVFGLSGRAVDAGLEVTTDMAIDDVSIDSPSCSTTTSTVMVAADTMLLHENLVCNPSIRNGAAATMNIGQGGGAGTYSRVLLRFAIDAAMDTAITDGTARGGNLTLTIRTTGGGCGATCPNAATNFQLYAASNDWNEGAAGGLYVGAGWCNRQQTLVGNGVPWIAPGADSPADRSTMALSTAVIDLPTATAGGEIEIAFSLDTAKLDELRARRAGTELALILIRTSGGTLFLHTRESMPTATRLSLEICSP